MVEKIRKQQILDLVKCLLVEYFSLLTEEEVAIVKSFYASIDDSNFIINAQNYLLPIVRKVWDVELKSGNYVVISWNKFPDRKRVHDLLFATLSLKDDIINFCGITTGVQYEINYDSIIGALYKDGATLIEDASKSSEFTIAVLGDKVVNSYNCATKFITPKQLIGERDISYPSKHNELILDAKLVKEIGDISLDQEESTKLNK